jgi:hypothetical protein
MKPGDVIGDPNGSGTYGYVLPNGEYKVRNLGSFRSLLREARLKKANQQLKTLHKDKESVFGHVNQISELVSSSGSEITQKEYADVTSAGLRLVMDVSVLLERLSGSTGDINALWRVVETAGLIGRFMGAHPVQNKIEMKKRRNKRVRWWHSEALVRAAKMQDYPEELTAAAKRIHDKLKDRPDGPPSWDAVRQVLRRDLAKNRKSKQDD